MMKRLIVNADEFGLTEGVNKGIIEAHSEGILSSASAIVNMWALDEAMALATKNPRLGVGVHLNITAGKPVLPIDKVRSLVDNNGFFLKRPALVKRILIQSISLEEVKEEFFAQIGKLESYGISPTHLDFHQNVLFLPRLFNEALFVAKEKGLPLRLTQEEVIFENILAKIRYSTSLSYLKKLYVFYLCFHARKLLKKNYIKTIDRVYSIVACFPSRRINVKRCYSMIIDRINDGISELMVHPGYIDERLIGFVKYGFSQAIVREEEVNALKSPDVKEKLKDTDIKVVNYKFLKDRQNEKI